MDAIAHFINGFGERCGSIHGDKSQSDRDNTLHAFRAGRTNILVATDVAARGLDVDGIRHVVNFDYPMTSEDYIHRIGRTGRRDTTGTSYTFFTEENARQARDLVAVLREAKQEVAGELQEMADRRHGGSANGAQRYGSQRRYGGPNGGGGGGGWRNNQQNYQRRNSWDGGSNPRQRYERRDDFGGGGGGGSRSRGLDFE